MFMSAKHEYNLVTCTSPSNQKDELEFINWKHIISCVKVFKPFNLKYLRAILVKGNQNYETNSNMSINPAFP